MKVICAGMIKTGTKSMAKALESLGYNVYDVKQELGAFQDEWADLIWKGKKPDFKAMFTDVDAVTDIPSLLFFEEILEAFPDSKVILTTRDEDSWIKSFVSQLRDLRTTWPRTSFYFLSPTLYKIKSIVDGSLTALLGSTDPNATQIFRKRFRMHNDRVKAVVPEDRLLVYSVTQGWEPLCDFLGHKVPSEPFPHENIKGEFMKKIGQKAKKTTALGRKIKREMMFAWALVVCVIACLLFALLHVI